MFFRQIAASLACVTLFACSSGPTVVESPAEAVNAPEDGSYSTEIGFQKGSAELGKDDKKKLDQLVFKARNAGEVNDIKVMSWADKAFSADSKAEVPDSEKSLAERRNIEIKTYLQQSQGPVAEDIDTFNMANPASGLNEFFKTEDARVKTSLSKPKTGKAMVFVVLKKIERDSF